MKAISALVLAIFLLAGCSQSLEKKVVGNWKVDTAKTEVGGDKIKDEADRKMAMAMMETITLNLKDDKSFEMAVVFPIKGTWALAGNKLTLTPEKTQGESMKFMGKDTIDFDVDASGATLTANSTDPKMPGKLVMVKTEPAK